MPKDSSKPRKRMVVEEVEKEPEITPEAQSTSEPATAEVEEKVEEPQKPGEDTDVPAEKTPESEKETIEPPKEVAPVAPAMRPFRETAGPSPLVILVPGILLLGAILGGVYFYETSINKAGATPTPTASALPSETPTASPSATVDITKYQIVVLNGSGIPGAAGDAKSLLVKEGFKVGSTGNADTYEYTRTIIKAKAGVDAGYLSKLSTTLSTIYVVGTNETLPDTSKDEVQVIVGSSKK